MKEIIELYNLSTNLFDFLDQGKGRYHMMSFAGHLDDVVRLYYKWPVKNIAYLWIRNALSNHANDTLNKFGILLNEAINGDCTKSDPILQNILCQINKICNQSD
jgi:hypothetical protein